MLTVCEILIRLISETLRWCRLTFRSTQSVKAENLCLRRQLALYVERGVKPRRIHPMTRLSLAILSRFFHWRDALVVVRPETMLRWHRAGWKLGHGVCLRQNRAPPDVRGRHSFHAWHPAMARVVCRHPTSHHHGT